MGDHGAPHVRGDCKVAARDRVAELTLILIIVIFFRDMLHAVASLAVALTDINVVIFD